MTRSHGHALTRRHILGAALAGAATIGGWPAGAASPPETAPAVRVDTHLHCFAGNNDSRFPYHANAPYRPPAAATPEHLIKCMDEAGVTHAIVVHPEPYQDDHRYLEHCLAVGKGRLKGTCLFFADRPGSLTAMADLARRTPLVAARIHAYAPDRLPPFDKPELRALWKQAADLGLAIQLHFEPRYAPGFEPLIEAFPQTTVLIDHLGRPFQGTPAEYDRVVKWSRFRNTVMKLSSIPATTTYPHRDITATIRRLTETFGPDRLMYGGGFDAGATGASYRAAIDAASKYLAHLPASDQAKILGQTAARLFGLKT
ncbi:amidohydrolase family protein [Humisphaera borealis]|uniref:Amidohydrolase family protein n=1 Tax=Humisphaera borealis TaxID=2807512 RepID=A0A7M2WYT9_9BACT|nr:amidohydrolase family protein [Humisphaera borealis]QOV90382.1 amidohydrolase family protein [Humisphaera borealis]